MVPIYQESSHRCAGIQAEERAPGPFALFSHRSALYNPRKGGHPQACRRQATCSFGSGGISVKSAFPTSVRMFGVALAAVFVAELADKTQLTAMAFAANAHESRLVVFFGSAAALVLSALLGVLLGGVLSRVIRPRQLNYVSGGIFLVCAALFALRFFFGDPGGRAQGALGLGDQPGAAEAFGLTFGAVFLAELGDKTQLATLSLAAGNRGTRWPIFFGAAIALTLSAGLACLLGGLLGHTLQSRYLSLGAAVLFILLGVAFLRGHAEKGRKEFQWLVHRIEQIYEDPRCRRCPRLMRFLEEIEAIGSETVSKQISPLLLPRDQWSEADCSRDCEVDRLRKQWRDQAPNPCPSASEKEQG